ncbi:hypothetical protein LCGC14_3108340 [marine sediment metagenome]|uniref:Uncharacterized protein n=1 Tax=marine sediment metagenome TaxID=412755 RepID=A0A0F8WUL0_9ZZZZ
MNTIEDNNKKLDEMRDRLIASIPSMVELDRGILSPERRYLHDPEFHALTDAFVSYFNHEVFTESDLRDAILLAKETYLKNKYRDYEG